MRRLALLGGAMWLASVGVVAAQAPPAGTASAAQPAPAAVVSRDEAEVRAGTSDNPQFYVTNRLQRGTPVEVVGKQIYDEILAVASGKKTKSELNGVGEEEFAPWAIGPTL